ncbi:MAG: PaaI family thioesterase [Candidatus Methanomethylophilaceae archaeon]|nr:PaaI family thioesterase [Candidatus Methanomethylophilaceae archaeon]
MNIEELRSRMSPDVQCYAERIMDMYNAPFARFLGIDIVSVTADSAECSMDILPEHMNSMSRAHGGAVYTVMDHAFGVAANLTRDCTGSSAEIKYYRPSTGRIRAVATVINRSRSMEMYDVRAYSGEGKLLASMTCTAFAIKRDRYGRQALPLLRRAGTHQLYHLPQVLQEDPC